MSLDTRCTTDDAERTTLDERGSTADTRAAIPQRLSSQELKVCPDSIVTDNFVLLSNVPLYSLSNLKAFLNQSAVYI
jgi:hypothetical protein